MSKVVSHQDALIAGDVLFGFEPQRRRVRFQAVQQTGERVMRGTVGLERLDPRGFSAGKDSGRGHQEVDVIQIGHFCSVHGQTIP